jgi:hypothetical protein
MHSITFSQAVKVFSNLSTISMAETINKSDSFVAVPSDMQYQEHLRDFVNLFFQKDMAD